MSKRTSIKRSSPIILGDKSAESTCKNSLLKLYVIYIANFLHNNSSLHKLYVNQGNVDEGQKTRRTHVESLKIKLLTTSRDTQNNSSSVDLRSNIVLSGISNGKIQITLIKYLANVYVLNFF